MQPHQVSHKVRDTVSELPVTVTDEYQRAVTSTRSYVRHHPWQAVGIAVAIGTVIGFLLAPRR